MRILLSGLTTFLCGFAVAQVETTQTLLPTQGQGDFRFSANYSDYTIPPSSGFLRITYNYDFLYSLLEGHVLTIGLNHGTHEPDDFFDTATSTTIQPDKTSGIGEARIGYMGRVDDVAGGGSVYFGISYHHPLEKPGLNLLGTPNSFAPQQPYFGLLGAIVLPTQSTLKWGSALSLNLKLPSEIQQEGAVDVKQSGLHETQLSVFGELENSVRPNIAVNYLHVSKVVQESSGTQNEGIAAKYIGLQASVRPNLFSSNFQLLASLENRWNLKDDDSEPDMQIVLVNVGVRALF